jgi:hypothetical protein
VGLLLDEEIEIAVRVQVGELRSRGIEPAEKSEIEGPAGGVGDGEWVDDGGVVGKSRIGGNRREWARMGRRAGGDRGQNDRCG